MAEPVSTPPRTCHEASLALGARAAPEPFWAMALPRPLEVPNARYESLAPLAPMMTLALPSACLRPATRIARGVRAGRLSHWVPPLAKRTTAWPFCTAATDVGRLPGVVCVASFRWPLRSAQRLMAPPDWVTVEPSAASNQPIRPATWSGGAPGAVGPVRSSRTLPPAPGVASVQAEVLVALSVARNWTRVVPSAVTSTVSPVAGAVHVEPSSVEVRYSTVATPDSGSSAVAVTVSEAALLQAPVAPDTTTTGGVASGGSPAAAPGAARATPARTSSATRTAPRCDGRHPIPS